MGISQQIGASSLIKPGVIDNTAARPASPYEGQVIYQKDTDEILAYNGTSWTRPANMPWGSLSLDKPTGMVSLSTTIATVVTGTSFTIPTSRRVMVSGCLGILDAGSTTQTVTQSIWDASSERYSTAFITNTTNQNAPMMSCVFDLAAGTYTFRLRATLSTGTNRSNSTSVYTSWLLAQDIGPA